MPWLRRAKFKGDGGQPALAIQIEKYTIDLERAVSRRRLVDAEATIGSSRATWATLEQSRRLPGPQLRQRSRRRKEEASRALEKAAATLKQRLVTQADVAVRTPLTAAPMIGQGWMTGSRCTKALTI